MNDYLIDSTGTILEKYNGSEKHIVIPEGIVEIKQGAFMRNDSIEEIVLPKSLQKIGQMSFDSCTELKTLSIPEGVKTIGESAFSDCNALQSVDFSEGNLETISMFAFKNCKSLTEVILPACLKNIYNGAFRGCDKLSRVSILGDNLNLDMNLFSDCMSLKKENFNISEKMLEKSHDLPFFINDSSDIYSYLGIGDENGCVISKGVLIHHVGGKKKVSVTDGVVEIGQRAFVYPSDDIDRKPSIVHLPCTVKKAEPYSLDGITVMVDKDAFATSEKLFKELSQCLSNDSVSLAYTTLFQSGKVWKEAIDRRLEDANVNSVAMKIFEILTKGYSTIKDVSAERASLFFIEHSDFIDSTLYSDCHDLICSNKSKWKKANNAFETKAKDRTMKHKEKEISNHVDDKTISIIEKSEYIWPTSESEIIDEAIALYKKCYTELSKLLSSSDATVIDTPDIFFFDDLEPVKKFYGRLRDYLASEDGYLLWDRFEPDELYDFWMNNFRTGPGQVGLALSLGFIIAQYAIFENNKSGEVIYAHDKWEYEEEYSSSTRPALHIEHDRREWKVYSKKGYKKFDM